MSKNNKIMREIEFNGEATIEEIFEEYRMDIYNNILSAIKENYKNFEIEEVNVVKISTETQNYSINLGRDKFITSLNNCIEFFVELEEYEKCQECLNIINDIKKQLTY